MTVYVPGKGLVVASRTSAPVEEVTGLLRTADEVIRRRCRPARVADRNGLDGLPKRAYGSLDQGEGRVEVRVCGCGIPGKHQVRVRAFYPLAYTVIQTLVVTGVLCVVTWFGAFEECLKCLWIPWQF